MTAFKPENIADAFHRNNEPTVKFKTLGIGQRFKGAGWPVTWIKLSDTEAGQTDAAGVVKKLHRVGRNEMVILAPALVARPTMVSAAVTYHTHTLMQRARHVVGNDDAARRAVAQTLGNLKGAGVSGDTDGPPRWDAEKQHYTEGDYGVQVTPPQATMRGEDKA